MRWFPLLLLLTACNTPTPAFYGVDPVRIHLAGSTFDIRVKDRRAEAIRLNMEWAPRLSSVGEKAVLAIEKVSGCEVSRLKGDAALVEGRLGGSAITVAAVNAIASRAE